MTSHKYLFKTLAAGWMVGSAAAGIVMAADEVSQLSEVVVTAERRTENLQKTPVAVTALSSDVMKERSVTDTWHLMQVVPGLQVSTQNPGDNGGSATFFLRGMGEQRGGNGQEPAVGVYVDGIYYPSLEGDAFDIVDLQQVQVLRGPQGTLFGRDTIGGAILYTTQKPGTVFMVDATASVGNLGRNDYTGTLNIPLAQWLAVRLTAGRLKTDGYVHVQGGGADAGGKETSLGRIAFRARPGNELTIDLAMQYSHQYLDGFAYDMPAPFIVGPLFPSWWNLNPTHAGELYGSQYASQCTYCQAGTDLRDFSDTRTPNTSLVVSWTPGAGFTIKSLMGWTEVRNGEASDLDGSPLPIFESYTKSKDTALSEEFQVNETALSNRLVWVEGLYYYHDQRTVPYGWNLDALPPPGAGIPLTRVGLPLTIPSPYSATDTKSYAAYVNGTFRIIGALSVIAGYRYSDDHKHDATVGFASAHANFGSNTWRAGLQYQWTPSVMSYATVSTGFRAGGFNPAGGTPPVGFVAFKPENDRSYELGMRMDLLDRRLRVNPTLFYNDWSDIQVQSAVALPGAGLVIELQNAAQAHTYGAELEAEARATEHLTLFGNFSSLTAHYTSIGNASGISINSHFERAPAVTYSLGGTYDHAVTENLSIRGTLDWSWEATQNSTPTNIDTLSLRSYGLLNGRLELSTAAHWSFALFGTNLLNKVYYVGGINFSANVASAQYDFGAPRQYGLSVRYNYQ